MASRMAFSGANTRQGVAPVPMRAARASGVQRVATSPPAPRLQQQRHRAPPAGGAQRLAIVCQAAQVCEDETGNALGAVHANSLPCPSFQLRTAPHAEGPLVYAWPYAVQGNGSAVPDGSVSLVLLAGGVGKRMGVGAPAACCLRAGRGHAPAPPTWPLSRAGSLTPCPPSTHLCARCALLPAWSAPKPNLNQTSPCRLQASIPKQYLELRGQPIATYSMQMFAGMPQVGGRRVGHAALCCATS